MTPAQIDAAVESQREACRYFTIKRAMGDFVAPDLLTSDALRALLAPEAGLCIGCDHNAHASGHCSKGCECICHHEHRAAPTSPSNPEKTV